MTKIENQRKIYALDSRKFHGSVYREELFVTIGEVLAKRWNGWTHNACMHTSHKRAAMANTYVCTCSLVESRSSVFRARARAAAPTKSGIFPISKWLMRLDARMSNLFYWMYTARVAVGFQPSSSPRCWITREASIRFVPSRESTCSRNPPRRVRRACFTDFLLSIIASLFLRSSFTWQGWWRWSTMINYGYRDNLEPI